MVIMNVWPCVVVGDPLRRRRRVAPVVGPVGVSDTSKHCVFPNPLCINLVELMILSSFNFGSENTDHVNRLSVKPATTPRSRENLHCSALSFCFFIGHGCVAGCRSAFPSAASRRGPWVVTQQQRRFVIPSRMLRTCVFSLHLFCGCLDAISGTPEQHTAVQVLCGRLA